MAKFQSSCTGLTVGPAMWTAMEDARDANAIANSETLGAPALALWAACQAALELLMLEMGGTTFRMQIDGASGSNKHVSLMIQKLG